jgi:hypothetical protein
MAQEAAVTDQEHAGAQANDTSWGVREGGPGRQPDRLTRRRRTRTSWRSAKSSMVCARSGGVRTTTRSSRRKRMV